MTFKEIHHIPNGDIMVPFAYYQCDICSKTIPESDPHYSEESTLHYCWDCSFVMGLITEAKYLSCIGIGVANAHASVRDGDIVIWTGSKPPWERTNKDERNSIQYSKWRTSVFMRDKFTCQHCNQIGGELNAHHLKPFSAFIDLRYEITNGLTLCKACHLKVHRKVR